MSTEIVWHVLINMKIFVAILLIAAVPAYAQAQSRSTAKVSKDDAQKVVTIISGDKAKNEIRETFFRAFTGPDPSEICRLHYTLILMSQICVYCHDSSPLLDLF